MHHSTFANSYSDFKKETKPCILKGEHLAVGADPRVCPQKVKNDISLAPQNSFLAKACFIRADTGVCPYSGLSM